MQEPRDEDLILYYYGEARDADDVRRRLEASPAAAERYADLCRILETVESQPVPEPWDDYGARVWSRLQPRLAERRAGEGAGGRSGWRAWLLPHRLAWGAGVAMLVMIAFFAGRFWPAVPIDAPRMAVEVVGGEGPSGEMTAEGRERILMVAVGEHLERSELLLVELVNAPREDALDLSGEARLAEELLPSNRLYRQAARRSGQASVAEVLDELERLLLDVAHSGALSSADRQDLRRRIESGGILFRVQIVGSRVEDHHRRPERESRSPDAFGDV